MSNCRFPQDIDDLINNYKTSCDKSEYKKLSMLVHPDRNPPECQEDANKHFKNLNSYKMNCEQGFQPGCKYKTAGLNIDKIAENPQQLKTLHPDNLIYTLSEAYKNNCNPMIHGFLSQYLDPEENKNCEEKAREHREEFEDIFNKHCNRQIPAVPQRRRPVTQSSRRPAGEPEPMRPEPQRRRPAGEPEPLRPEPQEQPSMMHQPSSRRQSPQLRKRKVSKRTPSKSPNVTSLRAEAKKLGCRGYSKLTKAELIKFIKKCKKSPTSTVAKLKAEAKKLGCKGYSKLTKAELVKFVKKCAK